MFVDFKPVIFGDDPAELLPRLLGVPILALERARPPLLGERDRRGFRGVMLGGVVVGKTM